MQPGMLKVNVIFGNPVDYQYWKFYPNPSSTFGVIIQQIDWRTDEQQASHNLLHCREYKKLREL